MMKGQRKIAKLYVLQGTTVTGDVAIVFKTMQESDVTKFWHMHLGAYE